MSDTRIQFRTSSKIRKQLESRAEMLEKKLSDHLIAAGLESTLDTAKKEFYEKINSDLEYLKRTSYVLSKLMLLVVNDQYQDQKLTKEFYHRALEEAENFFKGGSQ
jgi:hypothetical protein